jgi:hypothetical protein
VALIEFIRWLNESQLPAERFIINGSLDDTHLFIKVLTSVALTVL